MGIGDRHPSNIMMTDTGALFHIDFGHFLGNFKMKKIGMGIKVLRERSPVVFTKQMLTVINRASGVKAEGPEYDKFLKLCQDCYNLLRANTNFLVDIFALMVPAGIPELRDVADINYL